MSRVSSEVTIDPELLERFKDDYQEIWRAATDMVDCVNQKCDRCILKSSVHGCDLEEFRSLCKRVVKIITGARTNQQAKELTVSEIEKLLGYPVKVVKE